MDAFLVSPADSGVAVPPICGVPRHDQMEGSWSDRLVELAGRTCYDSLGSGRNSRSYHEHIVDVGHGSVHEHPAWTFELASMPNPKTIQTACACLNRKGVFVRVKGDRLRVTANLRAIREWFVFRPALGDYFGACRQVSDWLGNSIQSAVRELSPLASTRMVGGADAGLLDALVVEPETDDEVFASVHMVGSRGFSHEQVRHKTPVSQRSSRFCDESESPWEPHPLISSHGDLRAIFDACESSAKMAYDALVAKLVEGKSGTDARKQARGAARGVLGNALQTQMIVTTNIAHWKWCLHERLSRFADAEIRVIYGVVFGLLRSAFPDRFVGWEDAPCPDGVGRHLVSWGSDKEHFDRKLGRHIEKDPRQQTVHSTG